MINRYHIVLQRDSTADLVDWSDGRQWRFAGGYDASERLVSQLDCDKVVAWMGEQATYDGSLIAALDAARE